MEVPYREFFSQACTELNSTLAERFYRLTPEQFQQRSHLFNGRYENIYVTDDHLPELARIREEALMFAADILQQPESNLRCACWLNDMGPGHVTLPHTHDDDDELLSAVYYVSVPQNSGQLILWQNNTRLYVDPQPGKFVFFSPTIKHEVTENRSDRHRLSIAFNFGPVDQSVPVEA